MREIVCCLKNTKKRKGGIFNEKRILQTSKRESPLL